MLSAATLAVADRLIATLMTLVHAVGDVAHAGNSPTFPSHAADTLFLRLVHLVTTLIRYCNVGIPARIPREPADEPRDTAPIDRDPNPDPAPRLPSRPGWLLAALPGLAPAIAADLRLLLAHPDLAALLDAAPALGRALRPILRGLGLNQPLPPAPTPTPNPPPQPLIRLASPAADPNLAPESPIPRPAPSKPPNHAQFIPSS